MAKFGTDFSGLALASTLAGNGWTRKWTASTNFDGTVVAEATGDSDRVAEFDSGSNTTRNAITWDGGGIRSFGESFHRWRLTSNTATSNYSNQMGPSLRVSGDGSSETGIGIWVSGQNNEIRIGRYDNASYGSTEGDLAFTYTLGDWLNVLITATDISGNATVKAWVGDRVTDEPATATSSLTFSNTTAGGVGIGAFRSDYTQQLAFIGVADSGEPAPRSMADLTPDTAAPTFSVAPSVEATTSSGHTVGATLNENGTLYGVRLADAAAAPSSAQVKAGQDASGTAALEALSSSALNAASLTFSTGAGSTPYDYYLVAEDDETTPNLQASPTLVEATTSPVGDTTDPVLSGAASSGVTETLATVAVTTDEANGTLYSILSTSATAPSIAQIQAGLNDTGGAAVEAFAVAVVSVGEKTFDYTGLTAGTLYYAYAQQQDSAGNDSDVASTSFTTTAASTTGLIFGANFDGCNLHPTNSTITSPDSLTPTVNFEPRDIGAFYNFLAKIERANGKTPVFRLNCTNYVGGSSVGSDWRPWYCLTDPGLHQTIWYRWPSDPTAIGSGVYEFQLPAAFEQDDVWVGFQIGYPVARSKSTRDFLKADYPLLFRDLASGGTTSIAATIPQRTDELGRVIPAQPVYAYGLWSDDLPTDGSAKRTSVLFGGTHAGEHMGDFTLESFLKWLVGGSDRANDLLRNFKFYVYPCLNPSGRFAGFRRSPPGESDINRNFNNTPENESPEIIAITDAIDADIGTRSDGSSVELLLTWHGSYYNNEPSAIHFFNVAEVSASADLVETILDGYQNVRFVNSSTAGVATRYFYDYYGTTHTYTVETAERHDVISQEEYELSAVHVGVTFDRLWDEQTAEFNSAGATNTGGTDGIFVPQALFPTAEPDPVVITTTTTLEWRDTATLTTTQVTGITDLFYDLTGLTAASDYEFRVQEDDGTNTSAWSAWSGFTTEPYASFDVTETVVLSTAATFEKTVGLALEETLSLDSSAAFQSIRQFQVEVGIGFDSAASLKTLNPTFAVSETLSLDSLATFQKTVGLALEETLSLDSSATFQSIRQFQVEVGVAFSSEAVFGIPVVIVLTGEHRSDLVDVISGSRYILVDVVSESSHILTENQEMIEVVQNAWRQLEFPITVNGVVPSSVNGLYFTIYSDGQIFKVFERGSELTYIDGIIVLVLDETFTATLVNHNYQFELWFTDSDNNSFFVMQDEMQIQQTQANFL